MGTVLVLLHSVHNSRLELQFFYGKAPHFHLLSGAYTLSTCLFGVRSKLSTKTGGPSSKLAPIALVYLSKIYFVSQQQIRLSNHPSDKCLD